MVKLSVEANYSNQSLLQGAERFINVPYRAAWKLLNVGIEPVKESEAEGRLVLKLEGRY